MKKLIVAFVVLIILGGIWAVPGISIAGLVIFAICQFASHEPIQTQTFDAAELEGDSGIIRLAFAGDATLEVSTTNENGRLALNGSNGVIAAPLGELTPYRFVGRQAGDDGSWMVSAYLGDRHGKALLVTPDEPVVFEVGPPLTAQISIKQKADRQISLDFYLKGSGAERYTIRGPKRRETPRFEVRDEAGEIVLSGAFAYG